MSGMEPKKSDLATRVKSAIVMVAVAGTALWLGGWVWTLFVALVALGVLWEWWGLISHMKLSRIMLSLWMGFGFAYVGIATLFLAIIGNNELMGWATSHASAIMLVLPLIISVMATDIGAYFAGRTIGGPKIAPSISPSKTWSGLLGGMGLAGITLMSFAYFDVINMSLFFSAVAGAALAIAAQIGDFFESWMKRRAGVKDSGKLIPGHGGLFDRLDGLLAVANVTALVTAIVIINSSDL
jgi:phosphatidate cytidylyltransferase